VGGFGQCYPAYRQSPCACQLRAAGLVFTRGSGEYASYIFKHALVQDAAYSTLLRGQKQSLHRSIAQNLSERSGEEKVAELIARH
jgi:predicted ATPase